MLFYQKLINLERNIFHKQMLTRSDEKSCTKNPANTDLADTDIFKIVIEMIESDENHNQVLFHSVPNFFIKN